MIQAVRPNKTKIPDKEILNTNYEAGKVEKKNENLEKKGNNKQQMGWREGRHLNWSRPNCGNLTMCPKSRVTGPVREKPVTQ